MSDMDDVIKEFLVESYENLDRLERDLVELEQAPSARQTLTSIFRTIHTIKGTCSFLAFTRLEMVTHLGENLLSRLRDGHLTLTPEITTALLAMVDFIRQMLATIEATGRESDGDDTELTGALIRIQEGQTADETTAIPEATTSEVTSPAQGDAAADTQPDDAETLTGELLIKIGQVHPEPVDLEEFLVEPGDADPDVTQEALDVQQPTQAASASDSTIRVDVNLLDTLMDLVGELVLNRNQLLQYAADHTDPSLVSACQRLNLITTELQERVLKTRMQPIGNVWSKLPRLLRDLAQACGKQIRIEMDGAETELDKTLIEAVKDPLTHLVRNAVDHGIETPDVRRAAGKPVEGSLSLRACHEGGQVNIDITDDGGGIDPDRIKQKALQLGLITPERTTRLNERELLHLIFLPGFSTAAQVTTVSGRGVGMDVVKTNIEKIGGSVEVQSQLGQGTTLNIKLPLTLAIIPALIITSAGDRFAIPQVNLLELVRLRRDQTHRNIEMIHGVPVYRLRDRLLPLVYLTHELQLETSPDIETANIVVLQAGDRQFGLVVDDINDTEEIVVKPLGKQLKNLSVFAGATIMGDGQVALILDVLGLAQRASVISEAQDPILAEQGTPLQKDQDGHQTLLLFQSDGDGRMAIPLSMVARLEELPRTAAEQAGDQEVIQYRDQILPLIHIADVLPERRRVLRNAEAGAPDQDRMQVVVCTYQGRSVGLVVGHVLDIIDDALVIQGRSSRQGVIGTVVIQNRITELLDVEGIIRAADPTFFAPTATAAAVEA